MDQVADVIREATTRLIVPRFRTLQASEIEEKAPGETVTIADREAEAFIATRLRAILPGVPVVGEEAVAADPDLILALESAPHAWLVDPLARTLEAFELRGGRWVLLGAIGDDATVCFPPFAAVSFSLADLWV